MKPLYIAFFAVLAVYTVALVGVEAFGSAADLRHYVSDVTSDVASARTRHPAPLYAVNTSLSMVLLAGAGTLFLLSVRIAETRKRRAFFWTQAAFFFYLALDERFQVHEKVGVALGRIQDAWLLVALGIAELVVLFTIGRNALRDGWTLGWLAAAGFMFGVMSFADAFLPSEMRFRLALEDLSKTWAVAFFFAFAWRIHDREVRRRPADGATG